MPAVLTTSHLNDSPLTGRIIALDLTKVLAAFFVAFEHLHFHFHPAGVRLSAICALPVSFFESMSGVFFVIAGYFATRDGQWKKAWTNAFWCAVVFLVWNSLFVVCSGIRAQDFSLHHFADLYGVGAWILPQWKLEGCHTVNPANYPLWFMRDLIFLFLLAPIIKQYAKPTFLLLFIASLPPYFRSVLAGDTGVVLSPFTSVAFFAAGAFLRSLPQETQNDILRFYSPKLIILYLLIFGINIALGSQYPDIRGVLTQKSFATSLFAIWIFYQIARWMEVRIPLATPATKRLVPVIFLVFAGHAVIYTFCLPDLLLNSLAMALAAPFLVFALMLLLLAAMKKWCPYLLRPVAYYKIRSKSTHQA